MDPCKKIWFYSPLQLTLQLLGIVSMFLGLLASLVIFS